jgi:hypothetical protein
MIWSLALAAVGVLGLYLSGKKNYWGWGIGLGAQVLWIVYAIVTQQWGFILSALAYGWVYGKNFLSWRKDAGTPAPHLAPDVVWDEAYWNGVYDERIAAEHNHFPARVNPYMRAR